MEKKVTKNDKKVTKNGKKSPEMTFTYLKSNFVTEKWCLLVWWF
jgi:hypothetical protein